MILIIQWIVLVAFLLVSIHILIYAILQLYYASVVVRRKKSNSGRLLLLNKMPNVTIQLPIYNEGFVVEALVDSVVNLDYPIEALEIQILDDSDDRTSAIIDRKAKIHRENGYNINVIRRDNRNGYKAGALMNGLAKSFGEFIIIFDADFRPEREFLNKTIPYFSDPTLGALQTRWTFVNEEYNMLTRVQSMLLSNHFIVEQGGKNYLHLLCQFNGTAGVWRKEAILSAGDWCSDTLVEDLDLSYRAQIKGWSILVCDDIKCPSQLPQSINSLKIQQGRWMQGGVQACKKILPLIWKSSLPLDKKIHASLHLTASFVFLSIFISAILTIPMTYVMNVLHIHPLYFGVLSIGLIMNGVALYFSNVHVAWKEKGFRHLNRRFVRIFPVLLIYLLGISVHNSIYVIKGILGYKSPFNRTPKEGTDTSVKETSANDTSELISISKNNKSTELLIIIVLMFGVFISVLLNNLTFLMFQVIFLSSVALVRHQSFTNPRVQHGKF